MDIIIVVCGSAPNSNAVYESGRCIECLAEGFREDNPDRPDEENYADAEDWFSYNTVRAIPYMGKGAPIIIDGFGRDEEQWERMPILCRSKSFKRL